MKKIISLVLALMLTCTFCTPVFAAEQIIVTSSQAIPQGTYSNVYINSSIKGTIENGKTVTLENATIILRGTLNIEGKLEGTIEYFEHYDGRIIIGENGDFQLTFTGESASNYAQRFIALLKNNGIGYLECTDDFGNVIISYHKHEFITTTTTTTTCTGCGYYEESVTATSSILSQGYPEIVYAIASAVIFGFGGFLLGRKKKSVPANGASTEDEE